VDAVEIAARAASGDARADACLQRYEDRMARAVASVINLLDPDVIVLAGGVSKIDALYTLVPQRWARWVFSGGQQDPVRTRLLPSHHGDASGVRGAAWLWREAAAGRQGRLESAGTGAA
jgi:fructokinase